MNNKKLKIFIIIVLFLFLIIFIGLIWSTIYGIKLYYFTPDQKEKVEIVGTRIEDSSGGEDGSTKSFIAAFKFPDGSVKEFNVRVFSGAVKAKKIYELVNIKEGDVGILTYKERDKNILEKFIEPDKESWRLNRRKFVSFEKDS